MSAIKVFQNEEESIGIDGLTIENRLDRIELYGSLQITRDRQGLRIARELRELLDDAIQALEADKDLPDQVKLLPPDQVRNPFAS
jgi:hypothetical protein